MNKLNRAYIIALSLIAIFTISSQIFIQVFLYNRVDDAKVINIAGRQRMLSQKIVKNVLLIKRSTSSKQFLRFQKNLKQATSLWIDSHQGLQNGSEVLLFPQMKHSTSIKKLYQKITPHYEKIKQKATQIISLHYQNKSTIDEKTIFNLLKEESVFLKLMDKIVSQHEAETKEKLESLGFIEKILMGITLLILFLEAVFIFRPMIRKINQNMQQIRHDKKERENELLTQIKLQNAELKKSLKTNISYLKQIERQKEVLEKNNQQLENNQEALKKSHFKLKESLEQNQLYVEEIKTQKKEVESINEKLQINQEILKKSHVKLKKSLEKNTNYVREIQTQKAELQEKHVELQSIEEELRQSNEFLEETVEKRTKTLKEQTINMEYLYKNLSASVNYAQKIQQAILPKMSQMQASFSDIFIFFRPLNVVSGDFYFYTETSYKKVIAAVDCTGHGIPGAFMSLIANDLLYDIVKIKGITSPNEILLMLCQEVIRVLRQEETGNRDGMDLTICSIDSYPEDLKEDLGIPTLQYAGAKNPLVIIQDEEVQIIKGDTISIGGVEEAFEGRVFTNHIIPLHTDTIFYVFSDGIQDQFGGEKNKKLSSRRLYKLLQAIHLEPMEKQKKIISNTIHEWQKASNQEQIDDMLLLGVKI